MSRAPEPGAYPPIQAQSFEIRDRSVAFVLDASALLAMLQGEPGGGFIEMVLENSVISAVNWGEVVQKSMARGVVTDGMRREVQALGLDIQPFLATDAERAAELWSLTRAAGLSLGDRACLAVAARLGLPALTTDRAWQGIAKAVEVEVQLVR